MATKQQVFEAAQREIDRTNTDLTPTGLNPNTGYHSYELRDPQGKVRKLELWAASSYLKDKRDLSFDASMAASFDRRLKLIYERYQGKNLDPQFAMDMVASNLSDDEMVRLYDQRWAFFEQEGKSWWKKVWNAPTNPVKVAIDSYEALYDTTMNRFARAITNDKTATFESLFATGIYGGYMLAKNGMNLEKAREEAGYDPSNHTFHSKRTGGRMGMAEWVDQEAPGWVKTASFAGGFVDPLMFMAALRTARQGARLVYGVQVAKDWKTLDTGTAAFRAALKDEKGAWGAVKAGLGARHERSIQSFARHQQKGWWGTTIEDVDRLSKGELKWGDYMRGINLREVAGSKIFPSIDQMPAAYRALGFQPKSARYFEEVARAGSIDHIRALMPQAPGPWIARMEQTVRDGQKVGKNTREIAEDVRQTWVSLFDPDTIEETNRIATQAQEKFARATAEYDAMSKSFDDPLDQGGWPLSMDEQADLVKRGPAEKRVAFADSARAEWDAAQEVVYARNLQGSLFQITETVPRWTLGAKMGRWLERNAGFVEDIGEVADAPSILSRIGHRGARSIRGIVQANPHGTIVGSDDFAHVQFRRSLDEMRTLTTNKSLAKGSKVVPLTNNELSDYYQRFLRAEDDAQRFELANELSNTVMHKLGFNDAQIERITDAYNLAWGKFEEGMSVTHRARLPLFDPHLLRRLARLGDQALEPKILSQLMEKSQRAWKQLAVLRPAWFFRVVVLSEQPRAAMAGMPNLLTHPLISLAASQVPGVSKGARGVLAARLAVPGWKSRLTLNYGALDGILRESNMGMTLGRKGRAAAKGRLSGKLGTLGLRPQPGTLQTFHWEDAVSQADKKFYIKGWARDLNERIATDQLHARFLEGQTVTQATAWANTAEAAEWRRLAGVKAGTPEVKQAVKRERDYFRSLTGNEDPEIIAQLRRGEAFRWQELSQKAAPKKLPVDVFADTLERPGMGMDRAVANVLLKPIWDNFSANPSLWMSRYAPYQLKVVDSATRRLGIYTGERLQGARSLDDAELGILRTQRLSPDVVRGFDDTLEPNELVLWNGYVVQAKQGKHIRPEQYLEEVQHNSTHREFVQSVLDDLPDEVVAYRGYKSGDEIFRGKAGNASLSRKQASKFGDKIQEIRIHKNDIVSLGAPGEDEILFWTRDAYLPGVQKIDRNESLKRIVQAANGKPVTLNAIEQRILLDSQEEASFAVRQVFYDLNESSRVADMARFIAPFGNAWQEEITRWAKLAYSKPLVPTAVAIAWQNKQNLPFTYNDPRTGEEMFAIPWSENIVKFATGRFNPITGATTGVALPLTGRWKNLSVVTGSGWLPGAGPFTVMAARALKGLGVLPQGVYSQIDPYGPRSIVDTLLPSPFFKAAKEVSEDDPARDAAIAHEILVYHWDRTGGKITPEDIEIAEDQMRALKVVNAAARIVVGSGIRANLPPKLEEMVGYFKWASNAFGPTATQIFLQRYGDEAAGYMVNLTKTLTGAPATKEAEDLLVPPGMKQWAEMPAFWAVMSEKARGEWDPIASAAQISRGDRDARGFSEMTKVAYTMAGWYRFGIIKQEYESALATAGLSTRSQNPLAQSFKEIYNGKRQALFEAYPGFQDEYENTDFNEWKKNMRDLRKITTQGFSTGLQTTRGAEAFFGELDSLRPVMEAADLGSLSSERAKPLKAFFNSRLDTIFRKYPEFRLVYDRLGLDAFDGRSDQWLSE